MAKTNQPLTSSLLIGHPLSPNIRKGTLSFAARLTGSLVSQLQLHFSFQPKTFQPTRVGNLRGVVGAKGIAVLLYVATEAAAAFPLTPVLPAVGRRETQGSTPILCADVLAAI
jgi:hypothetical protein